MIEKKNSFISADSNSPATPQISNISATISGLMTIAKANEWGHPAKIFFKINSFAGLINEKNTKLSLNGAELEIDFNKNKECDFKVRNDNTKKLSPAAIKLLSVLFRPNTKANLNDFIGTDNPVETGDSWQVPCAPFIAAFARKGIKLTEKQISGKVNLSEKVDFRGIKCWKIDETLFAEKKDSFNFNLKATILLPLDEQYGAVIVARNARERTVKSISSTQMFCPKGKIILETSDHLEAVFLPKTD